MATLTLLWADVNDPLNPSSLALVLVVAAVVFIAAGVRLFRQFCVILAEVTQAITTASIMVLVTVVAIIAIVLTIAKL